MYRINWAAMMCPMYFYMAGAFRNEFWHNTRALGEDVSYANLRNQYDYHSAQMVCLSVIVLMGLIYKCIWLLSLRMHSLFKGRAVLQKVYGVRRRARKLIKAGLRWRDDYESAAGTGGHHIITSSNVNGVSAEDEALAELEFGSAFHIP